ncbi:MAG: hypothetical protein PUF70_03525 [Absicoccus porci]|nr:hypothetical protein [Absicoccus porci]
MDTAVQSANALLDKNQKAYDMSTKSTLKKDVKDSEKANSDADYKKSTKKIKSDIKAYKNSIKQLKQVTKPSQDFLLERAKTVDTITDVEAATEETDINNMMNKAGGYYAYIAMKSSLVTDSYYADQSPVEAGTDGGAVIEAFKTVKAAKARNEYLAAFDTAGMFNSGSHKVVGTLVIRTSSSLTASQQKQLEQAIIDKLVELK